MMRDESHVKAIPLLLIPESGKVDVNTRKTRKIQYSYSMIVGQVLWFLKKKITRSRGEV